MAVAAQKQATDQTWLGAKVDQGLFDHVDGLAARLGTTRSHVLRTVLRHTDVDRLLGDLRREADAAPTGTRGDGAAA